MKGKNFYFYMGDSLRLPYTLPNQNVWETQLSKKTENFMSKNKLFCKIN